MAFWVGRTRCENLAACRAHTQLLNSLSHCSLSASNLISVSLRNENEIIFALSRMCDWHSLRYAHVSFFLMVYNVHKSSVFHLLLLLLFIYLFQSCLFTIDYFTFCWKMKAHHITLSLPFALSLPFSWVTAQRWWSVILQRTFYIVSICDDTNNCGVTQFAR